MKEGPLPTWIFLQPGQGTARDFGQAIFVPAQAGEEDLDESVFPALIDVLEERQGDPFAETFDRV